MNLSSASLHDLAERLLAEERDPGKGFSEPAVARVCGKLGALLSKLAGAAGYRSLLSRALALAQAEMHALKTIRVRPDGTLIGFHEAKASSEEELFARGAAVLVAQLLGLLITFIGEPLTLQLLKEAWPAIVTITSFEPPKP